jgi:tetratricopeptide (TPR) repeat protein
MAGTLLVASGNLPRGRRVLDELHRRRTEASSGFVESCYQNLTGEIALAEGRPGDAARAFSSAATHYPGVATTQGLARAFMAQRAWPSAREKWTSVIESRGQLLQYGLAADWVLAHLERARASREMGDLAAARADYEKFLRLWQKAGDLPVLQVAAAEYRALPLNSP